MKDAMAEKQPPSCRKGHSAAEPQPNGEAIRNLTMPLREEKFLQGVQIFTFSSAARHSRNQIQGFLSRDCGIRMTASLRVHSPKMSS
jgi:hypothetical protein